VNIIYRNQEDRIKLSKAVLGPAHCNETVWD